MTAGFDPAMGFPDLGRNLDLIMWSLAETEFDLDMGGFLVVLGGEKIITAEIDDLFGDLRLTARRIDADEAANPRARGGQFRQQQADRRDLVGFFAHGALPWHLTEACHPLT